MDFDLRKPEAELLRAGKSDGMSKGSFNFAIDSCEVTVPVFAECAKHVPVVVDPIKDFIEWIAVSRREVVVPLKTELRLSRILLWIANDAFPVGHLIRGG